LDDSDYDKQIKCCLLSIDRSISILLGSPFPRRFRYFQTEIRAAKPGLSIAKTLGMTKRTVEININQLKKFDLVEREGAKKNGHWIVKMDKKEMKE
jgi:hypothetical protein